MKQKVVLVGAGLSGALLSIMLARKGCNVVVYEKRPDMRVNKLNAGRSINLALSDRGLKAIEKIGMKDQILDRAISMHGRMVHPLEGDVNLQPYSGKKDRYINSISRSELNMALLDKADEYEDIKIHFDSPCVGFNYQSGYAKFDRPRTGVTITELPHTTIAADGAGSVLRKAMLDGGVDRFTYSQKYLEHGYKELSIPPGEEGSFKIEINALHIWPRKNFMMIALPNIDGSFTCTLFMSYRGENGFDKLNSEILLRDFFSRNFPDAVELMPTLNEDFFKNPTASLATVKCTPWHSKGKLLLIGDAAHAVVPFYGQGMNASFEDCVLLDGLIEKHDFKWSRIYEEYEHTRKKDTDAIADLAVKNYTEMRDSTANPVFVRKRKLEFMLEEKYEDFYSKYSMVTFSPEIPYSVAKELGEKQDEYLMRKCANLTNNFKEVDLESIYNDLKALRED